MSVSWNPWHGCQRVSEGCRECYVYRQDAAWQKDGGHVVKNDGLQPPRAPKSGRPVENSGRGDGVYLFYIGLSACRGRCLAP